MIPNHEEAYSRATLVMDHDRSGTELSAADLVDTSLAHGGACIPSFIDSDQLQKIEIEIEQAFQLDTKFNNERSCPNGSYYLIPRNALENFGDDYSGILSFLSDPFLQEVGRLHSGLPQEDAHRINNHVGIEVNSWSSDPMGTQPHFDRIPALEMFIYLHDTDRNPGAIFFYPGSHIGTRRYLRNQLGIDPNPLHLRNFIPSGSLPPRPFIEAPAGTLIIVDTMVIHGGGDMTEGYARKTIRGTTWVLPEKSAYIEPAAIQVPNAYSEDRMPEVSEKRMQLPELDSYRPAPK